MWTRELFPHKPVIGMIHLDALPGTALFDAHSGLGRVLDHAMEDYENLTAGGIDSVIFCNENDKPYTRDAGKEVVAAMTAIAATVVRGAGRRVPFGIDVQWDPMASLAIAMATGADYIRGIACGTFCGDLGLYAPDAEGILKFRRRIGAHVRILSNLMPEFSGTLDPRPITLVAQTAVRSALVDGICVSGAMAGQAFDQYGPLREIKSVLPDVPVIANTGVNFASVNEILSIADGCVVATCLKVDGDSKNRIDRANVQRLMEAVKGARL